MEFMDAVRVLRQELDLSQTDLASALKISSATVSRWELGKNMPTRAVFSALLNYANKYNASHECTENMKSAMAAASRHKYELPMGNLITVEQASIRQLIDEASFPIYVADIETKDLLYINHRAEKIIGGTLPQMKSRKCYECIMHRTEPCERCHESDLTYAEFKTFDAFRPEDHSFHKIQAKLIQWNGRKAKVVYVTDIANSVSISMQQEHEQAYREQLRVRRECVRNAVLSGKLNLSRNVLTDVVGQNKALSDMVQRVTPDDLFKHIDAELFSDADLELAKKIKDRESMIQLFYTGMTHVSIRHQIKNHPGYYESTFDLMQNPVTYDVEAFVCIWNITDATMAEDILHRLAGTEYETITTIDAGTGEAHPYIGNHIDDVIREQKSAGGNNVAGVEAYLRKYCADDDLERVIRETSLDYVKEKLSTRDVHDLTYSLRIDGKVIYKRAVYMYLDRAHTMILCAMQQLTELHNKENRKRDRIIDAIEILQSRSGMNTARYDLRTKRLYISSALSEKMKCAEVIENVPEIFLNQGLISPSSEKELLSFAAKMREGKAAAISVACKYGEDGYRWFRVGSQIINDDDGNPYQAIILFYDLEKAMEKTTVYQKLHQLRKEKAGCDYSLFRSNLTRDTSFDGQTGELLKIAFPSFAKTFNGRTKVYADKFVHPDDYDAYMTLMNSDRLLAGFNRGTHTSSLVYREHYDENDYRRIKLTVELVKHPDCEDVEAFLLYEKND